MAVITISREYGSEGGDIGRNVAKILDYSYVDKELITEVAKRARVPEIEVEKLDERGEDPVIHFLEKLFEYGKKKTASEPPIYCQDDGPLNINPEGKIRGEWDRETQLKLFQSVIRAMWERDNTVIIGRLACFILAEKPHTLHVRIISPLEKRCQYVIEHEHLSHEDATRLIFETDDNRARYAKQYYDVDWDDPTLYDMVLNTAKLANDSAAKLIVKAVKFSKQANG